MMDRLGYFKWVTADPTALNAVDRQIVVRQIVDELQEICDREAGSGGIDRYPALNRLLQTIRASIISIAEADDSCWEGIIDELLQLRTTMVDLRASQGARISH
ncbi:hypothetical protein [Rhizobium laguerreae]|uniref:hypothetical protein n=1 Tax=Rhizobium laguerreae TaxID=1076926 RepID=UPI001FEF161B|nr:hypothetical protein [Rhizobium laguerreae]